MRDVLGGPSCGWEEVLASLSWHQTAGQLRLAAACPVPVSTQHGEL